MILLIFVNILFTSLPYSNSLISRLHTYNKIRNSNLLFASNNNDNTPYVSYLDRMVERKKIEVNNLLRRHQEADDPLVMRMSYMASSCNYNVSSSLKLHTDSNKLHQMSIMIDMKRQSPTITYNTNVVDYSNAGYYSELLTRAGVDAFLINTDSNEYGGKEEELKESVISIRNTINDINSKNSNEQNRPTPACILKDIIIHPIQIAQALERGANGVLLIAAVVGADLEVLLDACTIMGTEAIVEVHTPNELEFALSKGATIFLVNMWDRTTGRLFEDQAKGMASLMPLNSIAIAAGNINSLKQVAELGYYGYDSIVLGRNIAQLPDIKEFIDGVHSFRGPERGVGMGMKGLAFGSGAPMK